MKEEHHLPVGVGYEGPAPLEHTFRSVGGLGSKSERKVVIYIIDCTCS